jgi:hypothetical protein
MPARVLLEPAAKMMKSWAVFHRAELLLLTVSIQEHTIPGILAE